jgi:DNA-directed RNA polymerase sigma subunit (sigma70/sigma32)
MCKDVKECSLRQLVEEIDETVCLEYEQGCCVTETASLGRCSLETIGEIFGGVTREYVRQIEKRALRRLRHPKRIVMLKELYLEILSHRVLLDFSDQMLSTRKTK